MDKIAKTCGHYDAYRQGVEFDMHLELLLPEASKNNNKKNVCYNMDSNELAEKIKADLVYIDLYFQRCCLTSPEAHLMLLQLYLNMKMQLVRLTP